MRKFAASIIVITLLVLAAASAHATILFAGGEDVDFGPGIGGVGGGATTTGLFRAAWARQALFTQGGSVADPNANRIPTPVFASSSTVWVHAQWVTQTAASTIANNQQIFWVNGSDGNPAIVVRGTNSANTVKISKRSVAGSFTDLVTSSPFFTTSALVQLDLAINYAVSGSVTLYANSIQVATFSGDVTTDSRTALNQVFLASATNANTFYDFWSEVIISTADTRATNLFTLYPLASGNATAWSNSSGSTPCPGLIGQLAVNDANYVYTASNTQIEECTVYHTIPSGNYSVQALVMSARTLVGATGPQHFDFLTRVTGTDYASSDQAPNNSFNNISNYIQTTNPATSSAWNFTDFMAAGFNIGLESKP